MYVQFLSSFRSTKHCLLQFEQNCRVFANDISNQWSIQGDMIAIIQQTGRNPLNQQQPAIHIAVLDSGIRPCHPVFSGFDVSYIDYDCVLEPGVDPGIDTNGNGTFVAGIICNILQHAKDWIKISIIKTTGKDGTLHFSCLKKAYDLLEGKPELQDVFLICQASGFQETQDLEYKLKEKITAKRSLICAASNEGNWLPDNIAWPAKEAVAVGSHNENAQRSAFSPKGRELCFLAPGENIVSANYLYPEEEKEHLNLSGTSYAAPWVTALLAHFHLQLPYRYPGNIRFPYRYPGNM